MLEENLTEWKEQCIKQGYAEGYAKGYAEGYAMGCIEGAGLTLMYWLEGRFGSLPDSVTSYIKNFADLDGLIEFALFASHAESLQAVIDQININNTLP